MSATNESTANLATSTSQKSGARTSKLEKALQLVLDSVENPQEVSAALKNFKWREKAQKSVESVLSLYANQQPATNAEDQALSMPPVVPTPKDLGPTAQAAA